MERPSARHAHPTARPGPRHRSRPPPLGDLIRTLESRGLLRTLLPGGSRPPSELEIADVTMDSRQVRAGALFVAIDGLHLDGHEFVPAAARSGAVAIVAERATPGLRIPQILVPSSRPALALAAGWFNGYPSRRLGVVGVTGTDGKTTTAFL
ncbi:MAG: hypothetical protein H0W07_07995, partial [Chloroflexi bacterium]|nr:hypothetical protein [Chloroflexota bacterium]